MSADHMFSLCNLMALAGWVLLAVTPRRHWVSTTLAGRVIPLLISGLYFLLLLTHWGERSGNFSTLAGVASLFSNRWLLLAGWIHYLAFDLFIGSWEMRDAAERNIPHWFVIPCLFLTFMFGPMGLLSYFALCGITGRSRRTQEAREIMSSAARG